MAERGPPAGAQVGHQLGQLGERRGAGEQRVVRRVAEQVEGQREPLAAGPPVPPGERHLADLAGAHPQPAGVEGAAEVEPDRGVAVPAEVDHLAVRRQQLERALQPGLGGAGVHDEVASARWPRRDGRTRRPRDVGHLGPGRVDVDQGDLDAGDRGQQPGHAAADHPGADHR